MPPVTRVMNVSQRNLQHAGDRSLSEDDLCKGDVMLIDGHRGRRWELQARGAMSGKPLDERFGGEQIVCFVVCRASLIAQLVKNLCTPLFLGFLMV